MTRNILAVTISFLLTTAAGASAYTFTTINVPGAFDTSATGINNRGQVVGDFSTIGHHGFLRDGATLTIVVVPGAAATMGTFATGINSSGQIVGYYYLVQFSNGTETGIAPHGLLRDA